MTTAPTDRDSRCLYHLARARLLLDALAETESKHARALRIISAELNQAVAVLRGTASPKNWQRAARISEAS
jgi:hypothetical protein